MQVIRRFLILWLFIVPVCILANDQLKQSLQELGSTDPARYEIAKSFLVQHADLAKGDLRSLVQDSEKSPVVRLRAVLILGEMKDTESVEVFTKALMGRREQNARVRVEMVRALAAMGRDEVVIDYFNSMLEDSSIVKASIALALRDSGDEKAKVVLSKLARSGDDDYVFKAAAIAIQDTYARHSKAAKLPSINLKVGNVATVAPASSGVVEGGPVQSYGSQESDGVGNGGKFLHASKADLAVIASLKAQEKNPNKDISETAHQLLEELTALYGKT